MATTPALVAHVWRRLGFGPTAADIKAGTAVGAPAVIDDLLSRTPTTATDWAWPTHPERWQEYVAFFDRNVELMVTSRAPVQERVYWILSQILVLASTDSVQYNDHKQHVSTLRAWPTMAYRKLLNNVVRSTGMQEYLNGVFSEPPHPNENLARELLELFSLGVTHPLTGKPNYTETDIKEIARALTGYRFNWTTEQVYFDSRYWDSGTKRFLGADRGAARVPEVITAIGGHSSFRYFVPRRLYRELIGVDPPADVLRALGDTFGATGNLNAVVAAIARRPEFLADSTLYNRVKSPLELVTAAIRVLGMRDLPRLSLGWVLSEMRQQPFNAPNVNGWPQGPAWYHAGHLITWSHFAYWWAFSDDGTSDTPELHQLPAIRSLHRNGSNSTGGDLALRLAGLYGASANTRQAVRDLAAAGRWDHWRACAVMALVLLSPEFLAN